MKLRAVPRTGNTTLGTGLPGWPGPELEEG